MIINLKEKKKKRKSKVDELSQADNYSWTAHIRLTLCHFSSPNLSNTPSKFSGLIKLQSSHVSLCHVIGVAPLLRGSAALFIPLQHTTIHL